MSVAPPEKIYIGDGVYISNDGWQLILETERENGTNVIYLEPHMVTLLIKYAESIGLNIPGIKAAGRAK